MTGRILIIAPPPAAAALEARLRAAFLDPLIARDVNDAAARLRAGEAELVLAAPDPDAARGRAGEGRPVRSQGHGLSPGCRGRVQTHG